MTSQAISSPGSFYQGDPIEKTYNPSQYLSTRRNLGGLVEKGYLLEEKEKNRRKYRTNPDIVL